MTKSEEWDKKINWKPALPFTPKILIGLGILVLLVTLLIAFATPPIYAQLFGSVLETSEEVITDLDQSYHVAILTSQALLMEKIDWNNCAILNKETRGYNAPFSGGWDEQVPSDLIDDCGEIP